MFRVNWSLLLLINLLIGMAHAEIPLNLVQTLQLPPGTEEASLRKWDVQHWDDASTWGWAALSGDTVLYSDVNGHESRRWTIPPETYVGIDESGPTFEHAQLAVRLVRFGGAVPVNGIVLSSHAESVHEDQSISGWNSLYLIDLESDTIAGFRTLRYPAFVGGSGYSHESTISQYQILCWPPPPNPNARLIVTQRNGTADYEGGGSRSSSSVGECLSFTLPNFAVRSDIVGWDNIDPFVQTDSLRCAGSGSASWSWNCRDVDSSSWYGLKIGLINLSNQIEDSLTIDGSACAQQDSNGTRRIIVYGWPGVTAYAANGLYPLWTNFSLRGYVYSARIAGCADERILAYNESTHRFAVFDAVDGAFLDSTSALAGDFQYFIKRPGFVSEFVSYDSATRIVRLFKSSPIVTRLTCRHIPETGRIRLQWSSVLGATRYRVYMAPALADNPYQNLGDVPPDVLFYEFAPNPQMRFFYVTADVGAR